MLGVSHGAMAGSFERFLAILIEHFAGAFPVWISPEQVRVIPISDAQTAAARKVAERLEAAGLRVHVDDRSETLNYRIREGEVWKVPYMAHPMGPLALADFIGLDVCLAILEVLHRGLGDDKYRAAPLLRRMVAAGDLGRKTGKGFYHYGAKG